MIIMLRNKLLSSAVKGIFALAFIGTSSATMAADRILKSQGEYYGEALPFWKEVALFVCFIAGLMAILFGGWQFLKKYVLAKSDHDKSFTIGEMIAAMVVGGLVAFPSGAMLFGQDLAVGTGTVQKVDAADFDLEE
jgi:hypothetical protein